MTYDTNTLLALTPQFAETYNSDTAVVLTLFRQYLPLRVLEFGASTPDLCTSVLKECPFVVDYTLCGPTTPHKTSRTSHITECEPVAEYHKAMLRKVGDVHRYFDAIVLNMDYKHDDGGVERHTEACRPFVRTGGLFIWRWQENGKDVAAIATGQVVMVPRDGECSVAWEIVQRPRIAT
jgi:hypothetical protein